MKTLNFKDMAKFESAFEFIDRVGGLYCEQRNGLSINPFDILINGKDLPNKLKAFIFSEYNGNLRLLNDDFNETNKNITMPKLIKYCYDNKVQPFELWDIGTLEIKPDSVAVEISFEGF